jgi:plasmid stability protein
MANFSVRNIPDQLYQRFKELANRDHRSLRDEVIVAMERWVAQEHLRAQQAEVLERMRRHRRSFRPANIGAPDSVELLCEDRD